MYFDRRPLYKSSAGESRVFCDVLPQRLTLLDDPKFYWHLTTWVPVSYQTLFEEVTIVPPKQAWSEEEAELANAEIEQRQVSLERFADIYFQALKDAIVRAWCPGCHLMLHSAGYDTRLMSMALYSLYQERGKNWLGDIIFVECANEADNAMGALRTIGWDESLFFVYNDGAPPDEYHARSLNFETAWERMDGGMRAYPFNMWWDVPLWAQEMGLIPDGEVQCWSAFSANNAVNSSIQNKLKWSFTTMPEAALSVFPMKGSWVFPFVDLEFMRTLAEWGEGQIPKLCTEQVVTVLNEELGQIPNPGGVRYCGLSDRLFQRALMDYRDSQYGQLRPGVEKIQSIDYHPWWGHWGLASLCEKLLAEGYKIGAHY